jgi:hypothetical protein
MRWKNIMQEKLLLSSCLLWLLAVISGCQTAQFGVEPSASHIEKSLPQSKLAYYNDSFEKMRDDIWEKSVVTYSKGQLSNFKLADMKIENGRLKIETKTECFSRGGFFSKYALRGDFDIQVDCRFDFLSGVTGMDQIVRFGVSEKGVDYADMSFVVINLLKRPKHYRGYIISGYQKRGEFHKGNWHEVDSFRGTLRIVRKGNKASTFYRLEGKPEWKKIDTFRFTTNDMHPWFYLQNFVNERTSISAESSITALFDNFKINAAQDIVEEEI